MSEPNDTRMRPIGTEETDPQIASEADSEPELTLPSEAPTANSEVDPPLPEYFLAGVLATGFSAACVAVGTSYLGLQGTLVGAVTGAMVGSIASQTSKRRLLRVEHRARSMLRKLTEVRGDDISRWASESPSTLATLRARIPWRSVASASLIALVGFGVGAMGLSAVELVSGRPVSAVTSGEPATGTTIQRIVQTAVPAESVEQQEGTGGRPAAITGTATVGATDSTTFTPISALAASPEVRATMEAGGTPDITISPEPAPATQTSATVLATGTIVASPSASTGATTTPGPTATPTRAPTGTPTRSVTLTVTPGITQQPSAQPSPTRE